MAVGGGGEFVSDMLIGPVERHADVRCSSYVSDRVKLRTAARPPPDPIIHHTDPGSFFVYSGGACLVSPESLPGRAAAARNELTTSWPGAGRTTV